MHEPLDVLAGPLRPMPEHLYDAMVRAVRDSLGERWGVAHGVLPTASRAIRAAVQELDGVYVAADPDHDAQRGLRLQLWIDRDDLDLALADALVGEILRRLGDQEILLICRALEDDGIHYRFASGTVDAALTGAILLVGPYARDAAHLARLASGQPLGFSA